VDFCHDGVVELILAHAALLRIQHSSSGVRITGVARPSLWFTSTRR
jgi:hypothetical protein